MIMLCAYAFGANVLPPILTIDDFDKATLNDKPKWWTFDRLNVSFIEATGLQSNLYSLHIQGGAEHYYVGGMGTYIGKDLPGYDTIAMDIQGYGMACGRMKIELYQNDRGTWQLAQDAVNEPLYDARFVYEIPITWQGWRKIEIPLSLFKHNNPGIGSDTLKLGFSDGTGGLLHCQLIFMAVAPTGNVNVCIDNVQLINRSVIK